MEDTCSSCLLRNKDRLSYLPDSVIYHILSFLETKYAVQTSVLSRRWRCAWKYVTALHFRSESFREYPSFQIYVDKVLSLRSPLSVREITLIDQGNSENREGSLFAWVIDYAISHGAQHILVNLETNEYNPAYYFSELFVAISDCNLKTLKLNYLVIDVGYQCSGFQMLTKLKLFKCMFVSDHEEFVDSFSAFPCLEHLVLDSMHPKNHVDDKIFRISGLRLLSLSVIDTYFLNLEIYAPKLKYFYFELSDFMDFTKLNLPSLEYAEILVDHERFSDVECAEYARDGLISLLQGFSDVTTLKLSPSTAELLSYIPKFLEQQASPFKRLETLRLRHNKVPDAVINYFLKETLTPIHNSIDQLLVVYSLYPLSVVSSSAAVVIHQWLVHRAEITQQWRTPVVAACYGTKTGNSEDRDGSLFASVIDYAFFHGAQYLFVNLQNLDNWESDTEYYFSDLFGTISDCKLKTLKLNTLIFDVGYQSSGFRMLTKLELFECMFMSDTKEFVDSFSAFPCLEHLVLYNVYPENHEDDKIFRISGLRLLSLNSVEFTKLNLPSLDYAEISVDPDDCSNEECTVCTEYAKNGLISLLHGLSNVTTLKFGCFTAEVLSYIPEFLEQQPSPFTRLKTLNLMHDHLPDAVINYFVKGSSGTKPEVKFEYLYSTYNV
ncbi:Putative F-box protein At3g58860 [Linum perenne]